MQTNAMHPKLMQDPNPNLCSRMQEDAMGGGGVACTSLQGHGHGKLQGKKGTRRDDHRSVKSKKEWPSTMHPSVAAKQPLQFRAADSANAARKEERTRRSTVLLLPLSNGQILISWHPRYPM